jgi:hypothetical protein
MNMNLMNLGIDWQLLWLLIRALFWVGILGIMAFWVVRRLTYKYWVIILERSGHKDQVIAIDEAKVIKDKKGISKLYLKGERKHYPLVDFRYKRRCRGGGLFKSKFKKGTYFLYRYGEDSYTPLDLTTAMNEKVSLSPLDSDMAQMDLYFNELEQKTDYKSTIQQWTPLIMTIGSGTILIALVVVIMIMMQDVQAGLASTAGALQNAIKQNAAAVKEMGRCAAQTAAPAFGG